MQEKRAIQAIRMLLDAFDGGCDSHQQAKILDTIVQVIERLKLKQDADLLLDSVTESAEWLIRELKEGGSPDGLGQNLPSR